MKKIALKGSKFFPLKVDLFSEVNQINFELPKGSKFFPFRVDLFSEGNQINFELSPLKIYQLKFP